MARSDHATFVLSLVGSITILFALGAVLTPPDPFTQLRFVAASLPIALVAAYLLAYRGGYETLQQAL